MNFYYLHITTWIDSPLCGAMASHYYGTIKKKNSNNMFGENVLKTLTAMQAKHYNKMERHREKFDLKCDIDKFYFKAGHQTSQFYSKDDLIETALKQFKIDHEKELDCSVLFVCDIICLDPSECIYHPNKQIMNKLNNLWKQFEIANNQDVVMQPTTKKIFDEWHGFLNNGLLQ